MNRKSRKTTQPAYESLFFSKSAAFLDVYLERQAGKSSYTRKSYKAGLSTFYDYVTVVLGISPMRFQYSQCSYQLVLEYSQYLQEVLHRKNSTVNSKLAAIKAYLEYVSNVELYI